MAGRIRSFDWARTPLGPPSTWSSALRMMVRFLVSNRFPLLLCWGPQYVSIYNDPYRPVLGTKHSWALGLPVSQCWKEMWHILQPLIDTPFHGGSGTCMDDILLEINRRGFVEETHFTIACSPVPDEMVPGGIGGVMASVHEITGQVVGERRVVLLRDLGAQPAEAAKTAEEACAIAAETLAAHSKDIPFALLYLIALDRKTARLAGAAGVAIGEWASPATLSLEGNEASDLPWPIAEVMHSEAMETVTDLSSRLSGQVPPGPWADPPHTAVVAPIYSNKAHYLAGFLVAGISSRLPFDDSYREFLKLVASQVATCIANAREYEEEKERAEGRARPGTALGRHSRFVARRDITQRKRSAEALNESEARYRALFEHAADAIVLIDLLTLRFLDCNDLACQRLGYIREEFVRLTVPDIEAVESPEEVVRHVASIVACGGGVFETKLRGKDGAVLDVEVHAKPSHLRGKPVLIAIWHDITKRRRAEEALRSQAALLELAHDAILVRGPGDELTYWNRGAEVTYGWAREEALGHVTHELLRTRFPKPIVELMAEVTEKGQWEGELIHTRKDGQDIVVASHWAVQRAEAGRPLGILEINRDITERKRANALAHARARLVEMSLTCSLHDVLVGTLDELETLTGSRIGFYHFLEADQRRLQLQAWSTATEREFCRTEGQGRHYDLDEAGVWADCVRKRKPLIHNDYAALRHKKGMPPGHAMVKRELVVPVFRGDKIVAILGVGNKPTNYGPKDVELVAHFADLAWDITERKQAEETLRESEERLEVTVENLDEAVIVSDPLGNILHWNKPGLAMLGYESPEQWRMPMARFAETLELAELDGTVLPLEQWPLSRILRGERLRNWELRLRRLNSDWERILSFSGNLVRDMNGCPLLGVVSVNDITERKQAELQLAASFEELRRTQQELLRQERLATLGRLAGSVAHEMRTPLGIIRSNTFFLEQCYPTADQNVREVLAEMKRAVANSDHIIAEMLDYVRGDVRNDSVFAVKDTISDASRLVPLPENIQLRTPSNDGAAAILVRANQDQVTRILVNLIQNAVQAMPDGGELEIAANLEEPGRVCVAVRDTGCGIPAENLGKIFEPLFSTKTKGIGLGLAIAKRYAELNGGKLSVESDPGRGTTFRLSLESAYEQ